MEENARIKISQAIVEQRKAHNLTQKDLGEKLNVSPQAVSKWETGLAEPDIDTLMKMCEIFGVTLNELCGQGSEADSEGAPQNAPSTDEPRVILGYCHSCKKPLYHPDEYKVENRRGSGSVTYCNDCVKARSDAHTRNNYDEHKRETKKSYLIGGIAGGVALIALLIALLVTDPLGVGVSIVLALVGGIVVFSFLTQMFWDDSAVQNIFEMAFHSFRMPGVIFSLDIGGIIFLITVKILLAILGAIASVLLFIFVGLVFTPLASIIIFPFALTVRCIRGKKLKSAALATEQK